MILDKLASLGLLFSTNNNKYHTLIIKPLIAIEKLRGTAQEMIEQAIKHMPTSDIHHHYHFSPNPSYPIPSPSSSTHQTRHRTIPVDHQHRLPSYPPTKPTTRPTNLTERRNAPHRTNRKSLCQQSVSSFTRELTGCVSSPKEDSHSHPLRATRPPRSQQRSGSQSPLRYSCLLTRAHDQHRRSMVASRHPTTVPGVSARYEASQAHALCLQPAAREFTRIATQLASRQNR